MQAQKVEGKDTIQVAIVDKTYFDEGGDWAERSKAFRNELEKEFGVEFEEADIGPSVSLPAFITFLSANAEVIGSTLLGIFLLGKKLEDGWRWWVEKAKLLKKFSAHQVKLNQHGASILAVEAVMNESSNPPNYIKLLRYGTALMGEGDDLVNFQIEVEKEGPTDTLYLGFMKHIFDIEADGQLYRVGVDGTEVEVLKIGESET